MPPIKKTLAGFALALACGFAQAGVISLNGDHFSISYDEALVDPLYKTALLSGSQDTVYFLPTKFAALTGGAPASTQAGLQFTVAINPGYSFAGVEFRESGDYFLSAGGTVGVDAGLQLVNLDTSETVLLDLSSPAFDSVGASTAWLLAGTVGSAALGQPQMLQVGLDNTLKSEPANGLGFIESTYVGFRILTKANAVPEPSGLALLLGGALAAWVARRRSL